MPSKQGSRFTTKITIFVTVRQKEKFKTHCHDNGISMSQGFRMMMDIVAREEESISYFDQRPK